MSPPGDMMSKPTDKMSALIDQNARAKVSLATPDDIPELISLSLNN
jgi:hypothetical protein